METNSAVAPAPSTADDRLAALLIRIQNGEDVFNLEVQSALLSANKTAADYHRFRTLLGERKEAHEAIEAEALALKSRPNFYPEFEVLRAEKLAIEEEYESKLAEVDRKFNALHSKENAEAAKLKPLQSAASYGRKLLAETADPAIGRRIESLSMRIASIEAERIGLRAVATVKTKVVRDRSVGANEFADSHEVSEPLTPARAREIAQAKAKLAELWTQEERLRAEMQELDRSRYDWRRVSLTER